MTLDIELSHKAWYLHATLTGSVGLAESRDVLQKITAAIPSSATYPILLDVRATVCQLSHADIMALTRDMAQHPAALFKRIAVLYCEGQQRKVARSFELRAWTHELSVKVFTDDTSAMQWLADAHTTEAC